MKSREDWLCEQLDNDSLSEKLKTQYERELDDIAVRHTIREAKQKAYQASERQRLQEIRAKILAEDADFINVFGQQEFGGDYEIITEGAQVVVYSKVARDDQEHRRPHETMDSALADLRYLFYNRLYDRYVRGGEISNLVELT
jgi:hypothetical protein